MKNKIITSIILLVVLVFLCSIIPFIVHLTNEKLGNMSYVFSLFFFFSFCIIFCAYFLDRDTIDKIIKTYKPNYLTKVEKEEKKLYDLLFSAHNSALKLINELDKANSMKIKMRNYIYKKYAYKKTQHRKKHITNIAY